MQYDTRNLGIVWIHHFHFMKFCCCCCCYCRKSIHARRSKILSGMLFRSCHLLSWLFIPMLIVRYSSKRRLKMAFLIRHKAREEKRSGRREGKYATQPHCPRPWGSWDLTEKEYGNVRERRQKGKTDAEHERKGEWGWSCFSNAAFHNSGILQSESGKLRNLCGFDSFRKWMQLWMDWQIQSNISRRRRLSLRRKVSCTVIIIFLCVNSEFSEALKNFSQKGDVPIAYVREKCLAAAELAFDNANEKSMHFAVEIVQVGGKSR